MRFIRISGLAATFVLGAAASAAAARNPLRFDELAQAKRVGAFTALQVRKVPSKLLTFPDEGHWVLKPGNSRVWHATVMDWLATYLGGARPDPEALDAVSSVTK